MAIDIKNTTDRKNTKLKTTKNHELGDGKITRNIGQR